MQAAPLSATRPENYALVFCFQTFEVYCNHCILCFKHKMIETRITDYFFGVDHITFNWYQYLFSDNTQTADWSVIMISVMQEAPIPIQIARKTTIKPASCSAILQFTKFIHKLVSLHQMGECGRSFLNEVLSVPICLKKLHQALRSGTTESDSEPRTRLMK